MPKNELDTIPGLEKVDWNAEAEKEQALETGKETPEKIEPAGKEEPVPVDDKAKPTGEADKPKGDSQKPEEKVEEKKFDIEFFNKSFNTQFDTEDSLKAVLQTPLRIKELEDKIKGYEEQVKEYESLKSDIEYYKNGFNPLELFNNSEDDFRVQQFKNKNPDKDASVAYKAFTSDLSKVDDVDVLVMYEMLSNPGLRGGEAGAKEMIADQYGVDFEDRNSWTSLQENKLHRAANSARSEFNRMKSEIELPKNVNLQAQREEQKAKDEARKVELKGKWDATVDNMFANMDKVSVYDTDSDGKEVELLHYVMDDKSKQALKQEISDYVINSGNDVTKETVEQAGQLVYTRFVMDNLSKIIKAYANDAIAKLQKKTDEEIHNAEKPKADVKESSGLEKERAEFIEFAMGGKRFQKNPLF